MAQQGFTSDEFAKLKEAEDNSNALVTTETIAMHAMKGEFEDGRGGYTRTGEPDAELARRIMHDAKYHADKSIIMGPIHEFTRLLDRRTEAATIRHRRWGDLLQGAGLILTAVALVSAWLGIRRHAAALRRAIGELSASSEYVANGAKEVASSSRHLAHGATEQVASLEEIAASAREMAAGATENTRRTDAAGELVAREQREFAGATALLGETVTAIEEIAAAVGGRLIGKAPALRAYRLQFDTPEAAEAARKKIAELTEVAAVENNFRWEAPDGPEGAPGGSSTTREIGRAHV